MDEPFELPFCELPVWWRDVYAGDEAEMWGRSLERWGDSWGPKFEARVIFLAADEIHVSEEGLAESIFVLEDDEARRLFGYLCGAALRGTGVQGEAAAKVRELYRNAARRWSESWFIEMLTGPPSALLRLVPPPPSSPMNGTAGVAWIGLGGITEFSFSDCPDIPFLSAFR
jgi:hypothetical protein